jgi:TolB-like protein
MPPQLNAPVLYKDYFFLTTALDVDQHTILSGFGGTSWLKSTLRFGSKREFIPKVTLFQNIMKSLRYALTFVLLSLLTSLYSQEQLVNRRVMLVNFTNLQNKADFEYLAISIPEAMLIALDDTKNFDLLQVSTWDKLVESGKYAKSDTKKDARVQAAGLSQGADVVVLGSFANIGQDLKITARAIEVKSGRLIVTKSVLAKTDGSMFGSIDKLSVDMANEMKNKLPPLPPKEVIREKIVQSSSATYLATNEKTISTILSTRFIMSKRFINTNALTNSGPQFAFNDIFLGLDFPLNSGHIVNLSYSKESALFHNDSVSSTAESLSLGFDLLIKGNSNIGRGIYFSLGSCITNTHFHNNKIPVGLYFGFAFKIKQPDWFLGLNINPQYKIIGFNQNNKLLTSLNLLLGLDFSLTWHR